MLMNQCSTKRRGGVFEVELPSVRKEDITPVDEEVMDGACCLPTHWMVICLAQRSKRADLTEKNYTIGSRISCCLIAMLFQPIDP